MYLAQEISNRIESCKPDLYGKVSRKDFLKILNNIFSSLNIDFSSINEDDYIPSKKNSNWCMRGGYYPEFNIINIEINMPKRSKLLILDNELRWKHFKAYLSIYIQHEIIHREQWTYRCPDWADDILSFKAKNVPSYIQYLSHKDEIDAYGHDIATEIKTFYPDQDPYYILKTISKRRNIAVFSLYKKHFKNRPEWQKVKKDLLKKAYLWLPFSYKAA